MTPKEFIEKFGIHRDSNGDLIDNDENEISTYSGNLEDMACPECGERDNIEIATTTRLDIWDGEVRICGEPLWDRGDMCRCSQCDYEKAVRDFTHEGLDKALNAIEYTDEDSDDDDDSEDEEKTPCVYCHCQDQEKWCRSPMPGTLWICSREPGHEGDHVACNSTEHVLLRWPQSTEPASPPPSPEQPTKTYGWDTNL